jgi:hypothetical protein
MRVTDEVKAASGELARIPDIPQTVTPAIAATSRNKRKKQQHKRHIL